MEREDKIEYDEQGREIVKIKELNLELIQPSTATFREPEQGGTKTIVCGKPGCFALGTPVLMANGDIKAVEHIKKGESVMGWNSTDRLVLELCRGREKMYTVKPEYGYPYTVNLNHILVLYNSRTKSRETMTVKEYLSLKTGDYKLIREGCTKIIPSHPILRYDLFYRKEVFVRTVKKIGYISVKDRKCIRLTGEVPNLTDFLFLTRSIGFVPHYEDGVLSIYGGRWNEVPLEVDFYTGNEVGNLCNFVLIEEGEEEYYGFTLNGDKKFLLGTFDVVHNTGKTTLIASLLYAKKHIFPVAVAMSGTEDSNHFYRSVLPSTFVFNNYDEKQIEKVIARQKTAKVHLENPWCVMILDDCTDDPALFRKPLQQGLYKRGRHWKMWYILSLQYGMDVRPVIRTNVDGVFILREPNLRNRKVMYENYAGIIPDFKLFCDILDQITDDYTALYIHNATRSNDWRDCVFWYKAKPIPKDFKFGCESYWKFHFDRYNPEYQDPFV